MIAPVKIDLDSKLEKCLSIMKEIEGSSKNIQDKLGYIYLILIIYAASINCPIDIMIKELTNLLRNNQTQKTYKQIVQGYADYITKDIYKI